MTQQFANGGVITLNQRANSTLTAGSIGMGSLTIAANGIVATSNSFSQLAKQTKKLTWSLEKVGDPNLCHHRRGGPRSRIYCEVPKSVPHDIHTGRGKSGGWFNWKDHEWD